MLDRANARGARCTRNAHSGGRVILLRIEIWHGKGGGSEDGRNRRNKGNMSDAAMPWERLECGGEALKEEECARG